MTRSESMLATKYVRGETGEVRITSYSYSKTIMPLNEVSIVMMMKKLRNADSWSIYGSRLIPVLIAFAAAKAIPALAKRKYTTQKMVRAIFAFDALNVPRKTLSLNLKILQRMRIITLS
ncbi:MAG: hypothetical protein RMJ07_06120 [Nitrososphaerota archaeon]|nr:hypothetical protein [Candidatus Bathyarchaeota archaeon]MDW8049235.1 hypothetical protein [Nitrososphaerota archaeon]